MRCVTNKYVLSAVFILGLHVYVLYRFDVLVHAALGYMEADAASKPMATIKEAVEVLWLAEILPLVMVLILYECVRKSRPAATGDMSKPEDEVSR